MRSPPSPSSSSSSYCSLTATRLNKRLLTIFKKAHELTTLCDIEACVIHYGADGGEVKTWPEERDKVRDLALPYYIQSDQAQRVKKSVNLYGFINKKKKKNVEEPISDDHHYSPHQINLLIHSLELSYSFLQERRRFLESRKQDLEIKTLNPEDYSTLPQVPRLKSQELCHVYDDHYDLVD